MSLFPLALSIAEIARVTFPGRAALTPAEVALLLIATGSESGVRSVRTLLDGSGLLLEVRRSGGRWLISIASLVMSIEAMESQNLEQIDEGSGTYSPVSRGGSSYANQLSASHHRPKPLVAQTREAWEKVWEKYDRLSALRERLILNQHLDQALIPSRTQAERAKKLERF